MGEIRRNQVRRSFLSDLVRLTLDQPSRFGCIAHGAGQKLEGGHRPYPQGLTGHREGWGTEQWPNKEATVLILRNYDCVTLGGIRNFAAVINLRIPRWGHDFGIFGGSSVTTGSF